MSKSAVTQKTGRQSLAERLAAVAGPQVPPSALVREAAVPGVRAQAPRVAPGIAPKPVLPPPSEPARSVTTPARVGKTMVAGYFTPQMAKAVKLLAVERDTTVQALIGEGLDMVLHKHGKHPMGER